MKGVIYKELMEPGETITAELYSNQLLKVNKKLQNLRPYSGHSTRKIILLHDNERPHLLPSQKTRFRKFVGKFYRIRPIHRNGTYMTPSVQVS